MNTKNDVEVIINGKQYTLSGYESSEYLQKIANHINDKIAEFKEQDGYLRLDTEMKNILLAINLSDEYYKALKDSNDINMKCSQCSRSLTKRMGRLKNWQKKDRQLRIRLLGLKQS